MSVSSDLISFSQQPSIQNLTSDLLKHLGPSLCLHSDVKLVADTDDTVLSPPLTASSTVAAVYRKRIQTVWMSCFNIQVRHTDVMKLYHMSLHVQYSVSLHISDILMFWNCITCHSLYNTQLWCQQATNNNTQYHNALWEQCTIQSIYHNSQICMHKQ